MPRISHHSEVRMQQRAIRPSDLAFLESHATAVGDGYMLTNKHVQSIEDEASKNVACARRLRGVYVVLADDCILTVYRADRRKVRKLLED